MGGAHSTDGAPTVVIVGCGYGGRELAKMLDNKFNVVVFDRKPYGFHNIGAVRAVIGREDFPASLCIVPQDKLLKRGQFFAAEVERIAADGVYLRGRQEAVKFDYCVVATGSAYAFPFKVPAVDPSEVIRSMGDVASHIKAASRITIVGGGPVGIELAGEIRDQYPDKGVTLVHAGPRLVGEPVKEELSEKLLGQLRAMNVNVVLNERAVLTDEEQRAKQCMLAGQRTLMTEGGKSFDTDFVFLCTGPKVNSKSYKNSLPTNSEGRLIVDQNSFQVSGHPNIFALGDCVDTKEPKMAWIAGVHAKHVCKVISALAAHKPIPRYPGAPRAMLVTLGPNGGAGQLPFGGGKIVGKKVARMAKAKDMMVGRAWKASNLPVPSEAAALTDHFSNQALSEAAVQRAATALKLSPAEVRAIEKLRGEVDADNEENYT